MKHLQNFLKNRIIVIKSFQSKVSVCTSTKYCIFSGLFNKLLHFLNFHSFCVFNRQTLSCVPAGKRKHALQNLGYTKLPIKSLYMLSFGVTPFGQKGIIYVSQKLRIEISVKLPFYYKIEIIRKPLSLYYSTVYGVCNASIKTN